MPISAIEDCDERHWLDVKEILFKSVTDASMVPQLVSDDIEIGIIQKRIVQNLYDNPVVVCDVSAKNPNVMLELGMRLAFDKPVIVVKDDKTNYSFDSSPIEHVTYPRDLRYQSILSFQATLREKILAMLNGKNENSFLKSFGTFKTSKLEHVEGTPLDVVLDELRVIKSALRRQDQDPSSFSELWLLTGRFLADLSGDLVLAVSGPPEQISRLAGALKAMRGVIEIRRKQLDSSEEIFHIRASSSAKMEVRNRIGEFFIRHGATIQL